MQKGGIMSPIQKIKEGVIRQDWSIIQEAYYDLTGEDVSTPVEIVAPEKKTVKKSTKKTTKKVAKKVVKKETVQDDGVTTSIKRKPQEPQKTEYKGKEYTVMQTEEIDLDAINTQFIDYPDLFREDVKIDKKLKPKKQVVRSRPVFKTTTATCTSCGRQFDNVNPAFVKHFRCNACCRRS